MPTPPNILDHLLVLLYCVAVPLLARNSFPRLRQLLRLDRVQIYRQSRLMLWGLAAATLATWLLYDRPWRELGLNATWHWRTALGALLVLTMALGFSLELRRLRRGGQRRANRKLLATIEPLIPRTQDERRAFVMLAISAGVCEEIVYRGFLIHYLDHYAPLWTAVLLSSVLFGFAHAYQALWPNVLNTGLVGLGLAVLYLLTGSLWLPMLAHAIFDILQGDLAAELLRRGGQDSEHTGADAFRDRPLLV